MQGAHYTAAGGSKKPYQPQPFRVPRPDDQPAAVGDTPRLSSAAEIREFFGGAARYVPEKTHAN